MNPSVDDRLGSVLRALECVVLPALPDEASLAREQVMLSIGQLQIIQAQRDGAAAFELEELADLQALARSVLAEPAPGSCAPASRALDNALHQQDGPPREQADRLRDAIDALLVTAHREDRAFHARLAQLILPLTLARAHKDRVWFAAMGFDIELSG